MPTANSKPFIIGVTVDHLGTYYLGKKGDGYGVKDVKEAQTCIVDEQTHLVCGKDIVGSGTVNDMVPLKKNAGQSIDTGFSLDDKGLHWKNDKFSLIKVINEKQGGEANWALYPDKKGGVQVYAQLGCPSEPTEKHAFHSGMVAGKQVIVYPQ